MRTKFLAILSITAGFLALGLLGLAHAATLDPVGQPAETVDTVTKLWRSGAILPALIVAAFALLVVLRKYVAWLREGKRAVYTAAIIAGLATLVEAAAGGATPNLSMIISALGAVVALVVNPSPVAKE